MRKVAIVGLPNSGKSTLFNRLTRKRRALVHRRSGMTRDRIYGTVEWEGRQFIVIDTGGVDEAKDSLQHAILRQVDFAVAEADLVLILFDATDGLRPGDESLLRAIRKKKPFLAAVNKVDAEQHEMRLADFTRLGINPVGVSAEHGRCIDDLLDQILALLPGDDASEAVNSNALALTIVGKPNAGKSTLLNRLVGYERASVSEIPGTTRDCVDAEVVSGGTLFRILDTAGIRRKARIDDSQEIFAVLAARRTIQQADCAILLLDGEAGVGAQDRFLATEIASSAKSTVVLVNKLDLATQYDPHRATKKLREELNELQWARILFISALAGRGTERVLPAVEETIAEGRTTISTSDLNKFLEEFFESRSPIFQDGIRAPIKYGVQISRLPVTIRLFTTRQTRFLPSYEKMLATHIRGEFGLKHSPIRIQLKSGRDKRV